MKTSVKILIGALLLINGIGALYGGQALMQYPDGSALQMPLSFLEGTPFRNYLIPGIILFLANGLFSIGVLGSMIFAFRKAPWLVIAQGCILVGWIAVQMFLLREIHFLQFAFGGTGIILIVLGWAWQVMERTTSKRTLALPFKSRIQGFQEQH